MSEFFMGVLAHIIADTITVVVLVVAYRIWAHFNK